MPALLIMVALQSTMLIAMAEGDIRKEIDDIKARLDKIEEPIGMCREHEEAEGHAEKRSEQVKSR